ncbi:AAA family ATPase [Deinococcus marmoris]|uniref:Chromosome partition protein smc n=1 Tax=Deinococcus marmoris TaxID=249408 RepID=A0A1U7P222_9DEIO|nr:SMC family ATPase [Deinococcus marmoris]OLV19209.1 Chromosome partition protein smc [Deinococcus marmoris]
MLQLTLENYRRYREITQLTFQTGLTIVTGPNGAGKSTLTEAILNALYGPLRGMSPTSDDSERPWRVTFTFKCGDAQLSVTQHDTQAALTVNGQDLINLAPGSRDAVIAEVRSRVGGLGRTNFERVYFALQGQTEALVTLKPVERKKLIEEVLQLDVVKKAVELQEAEVNLAVDEFKTALTLLAREATGLHGQPHLTSAAQQVSTSRTLRTRAERLGQLRGALQDAICAHEQHITAIGSMAEHARVAQEQAAQTIKAFDTQVKRQTSILEAFRDRQEEDADLLGTLREAQGELSGLQTLLADHEIERDIALASRAEAKDWQEVQARHQEAERTQRAHGKHAGTAQRLEQAIAEVERRHEDFHRLQRECIQLPNPVHDLEVVTARLDALALDPTAQEAAEIVAEARRLDQQREEFQGHLTALAHPGQVCPTCGLELDNHGRQEREVHLHSWINTTLPALREALAIRERASVRRRESWTLELSSLRDDAKRLKKEVQAVERAADRAHEAHKRWTEAQLACDTATARCEEFGIHLPFDHARGPALEAERDLLADKLEQLRPAKERYDRRDDLERKARTTQQLLDVKTQTIRALEDARTALAYDSAAHQNAQAELLQLTADQSQVAVATERAAAALRDATREKAAAEAVLTSMSRADQHVTETWQRLERDSQLCSHLTNFQQHFFAANTREVIARASTLLQRVADTSIRGIALDQNGTLHYRDASYVKRSVDRLSGGEKALVGLCLRLALAERAQRIATNHQVRFLVLDEVLSSLDDQRRDQVQVVLHEVLKDGLFDHIIMITHIDDVKKSWRANRLEISKSGEHTSAAELFSLDLFPKN